MEKVFKTKRTSSLSILTGMLFIVTVFYTYTGILGFSVIVIDILLFAAAILLSYRQIFIISCRRASSSVPITAAGIILLLGIMVLFFRFTFHPPALNLFFPPV